MNRRVDQVVDMGLGAGMMYFLDPEIGKKRRQALLDQAQEQVRLAADAVSQAGRSVQETARGIVPATRAAIYDKLAMDEAIMERARQAMAEEKGLMLAERKSTFTPGLLLALLSAAIVGAALMFILDPQAGRSRRRVVTRRLTRAGREAGETMGETAADLRTRAHGVTAEPGLRTAERSVADATLVERVRAALSEASSHPGSIAVSADNGRVILSGPILADEVDTLLNRVRAVPGVKAVENRLEVHREPGNIPGLQGRPQTR